MYSTFVETLSLLFLEFSREYKDFIVFEIEIQESEVDEYGNRTSNLFQFYLEITIY